MLTIELPNSAPREGSDDGADKLEAVSSRPFTPEETNSVNYCLIDCPAEELALADLSDTANYKNDRSSFLFRKIGASDSIAFELWSGGVKVADLNDATYGTYYASFTAEPLQSGFVVDWRLVLSGLGAGCYQVKAPLTLAGESYTFESQIFRLAPYSDERADGTVKLEALQTGNILSAPVNYAGLVSGGWPQSVRIDGFFGRMQPTLEADNYVDQNYNTRQIQDRVVREYTLETKLLPSNFEKLFVFDAMLGNELFATDYNILNAQIYRAVPIVPIAPEVSYYGANRRAKYAITFQHREDLLRKRNF